MWEHCFATAPLADRFFWIRTLYRVRLLQQRFSVGDIYMYICIYIYGFFLTELLPAVPYIIKNAGTFVDFGNLHGQTHQRFYVINN